MRIRIALVVVLCVVGWVGAEEMVVFQDAHLKAAVEQALWVNDPTPSIRVVARKRS